jgi:anti-sigma regulatory factor (Ser/Thr protein kinase)
VVSDGGQRDSRVFPPAEASVPAARRWAHRVLAAWGMGSSDAVLALNEMVTNAVVHGSGEIQAALTCLGSSVRLQVHDQGGAKQIVRRQTAASSPGGRGLDIIGRVSTTWGWDQGDVEGTTIWAVVPGTPTDI